MKRILVICMTILIAASPAACNDRAKPTPEDTTRSNYDEIRAENPRHEITGSPIAEEFFVENLDISVLEMIADKIQSLVAEIQEKERADPQYVMEGRWNQDFRESEQYAAVLELGLRAVKPAYYIIYKSDQMGLYEYILASAIDEITGYDYSVTENYQWSTSKEFLEMYNDKVKKTITLFREIVANLELNEAEKAEQICMLGIFAVAPLLNEIDSTFSALSADYLEKCLWSIIKDFTSEDVGNNLKSWRNENEQTFRDIMQIMEKPYK